MPELQPDILITSGPDMPQPCCECGFLSFYIYGDQVYCRICAEKIQAMINRLREQD